MIHIRYFFKLLVALLIFWASATAFAQQTTSSDSSASPAFKDSKSKIDTSYQFKYPTINDMYFYFVSLDGKEHSYLVKIADKYVYIKSAPKNSLGERYALPKAKEIKLYKMSIVDDAEVFTQIGTLPTEGFSDFVMTVFPRDGTLTGKAIDLSLENMPLGTMNFINLQPQTIGIIVKKKPYKLPLFGHFRRALSSNKRLVSEYVQVFSLKNPSSPEEFYNTEFGFEKTNRAMIFLMGLKKTVNAVDASDLRQFVEMQNSSPR